MFVEKNIKHLRTSNNMTLEDMAKLLGYKSLTTIQKWEAGIAQPPLKKVKQIADYFKVDIDDLANNDLQTMYNNTPDKQKHPAGHLTDLCEISTQDLLELISKHFGDDAKYVMESYVSLDTTDQAELRGEIRHMMKSDKYTSVAKEKIA